MPTPPSSKSVDRFISLFRGHGNAYGQYTVADDGFTKVERGTFTREEPPPRDAYERHLKGVNPGIGGIPVTESGNCYWGAIDYDDPCDPANIEARVGACGFPLVVCSSKSGGAHLYVFLVDPVAAELMMQKLRLWANALGLKTNISGTKGGGREYEVEVFPKQARADIGNWINLPYFGTGKKNLRWGVKDGKRLSFSAWLDHAEVSRISSTRFRAWHATDPKAMFEDGPPCLQQLHSDGVGQGMRNTVLFNMGTYFRQKHPDSWVDVLSQYNEEEVDPPLGSEELDKVVRSVDQRAYWYQCDTPPLCDLCQKKECQKRPFGVDAFKDSTQLPRDMPSLGRLTYISSEPSRWFLPVSGQEVTLTTEELMSSLRFRHKVVEQLGLYVPPFKQPAWETWLQTAIAAKESLDPPSEVGVLGRFMDLFGLFVEQRRGATSDSDLRRGKPIEKGGEVLGDADETYVVFTLEGLRTFLDRHRFYDIKDTDLFSRLRSLQAKSRRFRVDDHLLRTWWVPMSAIQDLADDKPIDVTPGDSKEPSF
jgi:hypothetical protein